MKIFILYGGENMYRKDTMKRLLSIAVVVAFILSAFSMSAFASTGQKKITVTYKDSRISYNGRVAGMRDSKGNELKSFQYNSQEYVPIRAIAGSIGLTATFDSKTNAIVLKTASAQPREGRTSPGGIGMREGNVTPGAFGTHPGNSTPGAVGMGPGDGGWDGKRPDQNSTPGAIGMRPGGPTDGKAGNTGNSTSGSVKITSVQKQLTVTYKNIKVTLDGKSVTLKDAKNKALEPFSYGGYEYVPLSAVAKAAGMTVTYDTKTNTYMLTKGKK
jgi:hypothetical protein